MPNLRDASQQTPEERKRIVAGFKNACKHIPSWHYRREEAIGVTARVFGIHEDTVRLVLSEEGE